MKRLKHFFAYIRRYWTHYHLLAIAKDAPYEEGKLFKIEAWYLIKDGELAAGPFLMLDATKLPIPMSVSGMSATYQRALIQSNNIPQEAPKHG